MKAQIGRLTFTLFAMLVCIACNGAPGQPGPDSEVIRPSQNLDFKELYAENCAGCHGVDGKGGAAIALADPIFLAIADDVAIRQTVANGVAHTPMPAFAQSAGGMLTDKQVDAIVGGMRAHWARPDTLRDVSPPPYVSHAPGDIQHGAQVYTTYCSGCHGPNGQGGAKASSIVNGSYLSLVSDQNLRTVVITGRPELGAPDWRSNVPGRPMSAQEISDVVAWLVAQRPRFAGQPYPKPSAEAAMKGLP